jgi:23S rRNA (guanosine2251-2'-O)-methyltransferase
MAKIKTTKSTASKRPSRRAQPAETRGAHWLYGYHAVQAALRNPRRDTLRIIATEGAARRLKEETPELAGVDCTILDRSAIDARLPAGAVHQGIALETRPLEQPSLETLLQTATDSAIFLLLDQVTDPHNVGAIMRSAAAFGAAAVLIPRRHAPPQSATLAKAASGALEHVPMVSVVNLDRALQQLQENNFWCLGLDADAHQTLAETDLTGRLVLVLGAEGAGLRRLTAARCDLLVRLPTRGPIDSLNVSNAAAVALYEAVRKTPQ